jgi:hypothetical protein
MAGPWIPRFDEGKLYGAAVPTTAMRCSASLVAIGALQARRIPHARCAGMIETSEESGSYDLPAYLEHLAPRLGRVVSSSASTPAAAIRAPVGHNFPAWYRSRHADRRSADRGRAFG